MTRTYRSTNRTAPWLVAVALLTACGAETTSSIESAAPSEVETPPASPSPSPEIDIAAAFAETVSAADFSAVAELSGSMEVGDGEGTISGSLTSGNDAFHQVIEVAFPGGTQVTEMIMVDGTTYELEEGLWFESDAAGGDTLSALPGDLSSLRVSGEEERDGDMLHRLVFSAPIEVDRAALGFGGPSISEFIADFEFFATATGVPAGMTLHARWLQESGGESVEAAMTLDYAFTRIGGRIDVVAPDAAWVRFTSEAFGYRMAHPSTWDFQHIPSDGTYPASDGFHAPVTTEALTPGVQVFHHSELDQAIAPNVWFEGSRQLMEEGWGTPVEATERLTIGELDAQLFVLHGEFEDGEPAYVQEAIILHDTVAWSVSWYSAPGEEERDRELFLQMLSTFGPAR